MIAALVWKACFQVAETWPWCKTTRIEVWRSSHCWLSLVAWEKQCSWCIGWRITLVWSSWWTLYYLQVCKIMHASRASIPWYLTCGTQGRPKASSNSMNTSWSYQRGPAAQCTYRQGSSIKAVAAKSYVSKVWTIRQIKHYKAGFRTMSYHARCRCRVYRGPFQPSLYAPFPLHLILYTQFRDTHSNNLHFTPSETYLSSSERDQLKDQYSKGLFLK